MKILVPASLMALLVCSVCPAGQPKAKPITTEQMDALAKKIEANAKAWSQDKAIDSSVNAQLKAVVYDGTSVSILKYQLGVRRNDPINIYVANKLLEPLLRCKADLIAQVLPAVKFFHKKNARYVNPPKYSPAKLKRYQFPSKTRASAEGLLKIIAQVQVAREEKIAKEMPMARHNRQVGIMDKIIYGLMAKANDPKEDTQLLKMLARSEQKGFIDYRIILAAIRGEVGNMDEARAKRLYKTLNILGGRVRTKVAAYRNRSATIVNPSGNSNFAASARYKPGVEMLTAVNMLAPVAKLPKVRIPTVK